MRRIILMAVAALASCSSPSPYADTVRIVGSPRSVEGYEFLDSTVGTAVQSRQAYDRARSFTHGAGGDVALLTIEPGMPMSYTVEAYRSVE